MMTQETKPKVNYGRRVEDLIKVAELQQGSIRTRDYVNRIFDALCEVAHAGSSVIDGNERWYGEANLENIKPVIVALVDEMIEDMGNTDLGVSRITIDENNGGYWNGQDHDTTRRGHWWDYVLQLWRSGECLFPRPDKDEVCF
jgi:hypothetical protein